MSYKYNVNFFTYRPSLYHFFPTFLVNIARYCATH
eukprot:SAG11_NODE_5535_length_1532_cov_1.550593_3_plen_34_part_01